ncbi:hypothetical protein [Sphingomonas metalli]|uniref:hypothetical protein n=1 Tax=Sphingomonas metalli TaxID=1779358 RepID=UPI001E460203|nr:hypothetical protein [Sphingomonas metalli]
MARSGAEDRPARRVIAHQGQQAGTDQRGIEPAEVGTGHDACGHSGRSRRGQRVDADAVFLALDGERLHQPDQRHLRRGIVRLPEIAV